MILTCFHEQVLSYLLVDVTQQKSYQFDSQMNLFVNMVTGQKLKEDPSIELHDQIEEYLK